MNDYIFKFIMNPTAPLPLEIPALPALRSFQDVQDAIIDSSGSGSKELIIRSDLSVQFLVVWLMHNLAGKVEGVDQFEKISNTSGSLTVQFKEDPLQLFSLSI